MIFNSPPQVGHCSILPPCPSCPRALKEAMEGRSASSDGPTGIAAALYGHVVPGGLLVAAACWKSSAAECD